MKCESCNADTFVIVGDTTTTLGAIRWLCTDCANAVSRAAFGQGDGLRAEVGRIEHNLRAAFGGFAQVIEQAATMPAHEMRQRVLEVAAELRKLAEDA